MRMQFHWGGPDVQYRNMKQGRIGFMKLDQKSRAIEQHQKAERDRDRTRALLAHELKVKRIMRGRIKLTEKQEEMVWKATYRDAQKADLVNVSDSAALEARRGDIIEAFKADSSQSSSEDPEAVKALRMKHGRVLLDDEPMSLLEKQEHDRQRALARQKRKQRFRTHTVLLQAPRDYKRNVVKEEM